MFFLRKSKFSGGFFLEGAKLVVKNFLIRLAVLTVFLAAIILFLIGSDSGRHPAAMTVTVLLVIGTMTAVVVSAGEFFIGGCNRVAEMTEPLPMPPPIGGKVSTLPRRQFGSDIKLA